MHLGSNSRIFFFAGWVAWWLGCWGLIYVEFTLRAKEWLTPYGIEAWCAMVTPLLVFATADQLVINQYERVWRAFTSETLGPLVLESEPMDRVRSELRSTVLFRPLAPRQSKSVRGQLLSAADWLPALSANREAPFWVRYFEPLVGGFLKLLLMVMLILAFVSGPLHRLSVLIGVTSVCVICLGYFALRIAARRQAVIDFFSAWRADQGSVV